MCGAYLYYILYIFFIFSLHYFNKFEKLKVNSNNNTTVTAEKSNTHLNNSMLKRNSDFKNSTLFIRNSLIPDNNTCGLQESDCPGCWSLFVFGGRDAFVNEFPWMALLGYTNTKKIRRWKCGGTIINSKHILTAAHCILTIPKPYGNLTHIRLGEHDLANEIDCAKIRTKEILCNEKPITVDVEGIFVHPNYDRKPNTPYDIALVRINIELKYSTFVRPICLPEPDFDDIQQNGLLHTAGWGLIDNYQTTSIKQTATLPYQKRERCNNVFSSFGIRLLNSQICVGGAEGKDTCTGDSGGPLMKKFGNNLTAQWFQVGIVSFGDFQCGINPAIYTKVSDFVKWIHNTVKP